MGFLDTRIQEQLKRAQALQAAKKATIHVQRGTFAVPSPDMGQMPIGKKYPMLAKPEHKGYEPWAVSLKHLTPEQRQLLLQDSAHLYPTDY